MDKIDNKIENLLLEDAKLEHNIKEVKIMKAILFATGNASKVARFNEKLLEKGILCT